MSIKSIAIIPQSNKSNIFIINEKKLEKFDFFLVEKCALAILAKSSSFLWDSLLRNMMLTKTKSKFNANSPRYDTLDVGDCLRAEENIFILWFCSF